LGDSLGESDLCDPFSLIVSIYNQNQSTINKNIISQRQ
jgi:hypothetical protein